MMINKIKGIYIHIPFCRNICSYCDFARVYYNDKIADEYLNFLESEMLTQQIIKDDIETIYIGGGTPSVLNLNQLKKLFLMIEALQLKNIVEYTIEINPEDCDEEKIKLIAKYVNRVSIGVQTFSRKLLKTVNRKHSEGEVVNCVHYLRKYGINNVSIDLMYGFNNQTLKDIEYDLHKIKQLNINHVAVYSLIIEKGSIFYNQNYEISDIEYEQNTLINDFLINKMHFNHYEVSNYSLPGYESRHNLMYWLNEKYYGFGVGASGYINNYRYYNTKSITNYVKGKLNRKIDYFNSREDYLIDQILTSFRIYTGLDIVEFNNKHEIDFIKYFENVIINNNDKLYINNNKLFFTQLGKDYLNDVIIDFIEEVERKKVL